MDRSTYLKLADECLARIAKFGEPFDPDEMDFSTTDGVVTLEFPDGARYVLNRQAAADQMWFGDLAQRIISHVEGCQFDPRSLILEITESAMLADNETTVRNLVELRSTGVRIALDDFGTGYSSMSHLDRLQIDIVKIDKSFIQTLGSSGDDSHSLAAAMVQLAHTLGYETIGEGVENPIQENALRSLGCRFAQGYHLGRPLNMECTDLLLRSESTLDPVAGTVASD